MRRYYRDGSPGRENLWDAPPSPKQGLLLLALFLLLVIGFVLAGGDNAQVEQEKRDAQRFGQWRLQ